MKAKPPEKQLYATYLDLYYSVALFEDYVSDLSDSLKNAKTGLRKANKLLETAIKNYEATYGVTPNCERNKS